MNHAAIHAAINGHPCTVTRDGHHVYAELICWGGRVSQHTARIRYLTGGKRTIPQTDITPIPCADGCDWCQP